MLNFRIFVSLVQIRVTMYLLFTKQRYISFLFSSEGMKGCILHPILRVYVDDLLPDKWLVNISRIGIRIGRDEGMKTCTLSIPCQLVGRISMPMIQQS